MKTNAFVLFLLFLLAAGCSSQKKKEMKNAALYNVVQAKQPLIIDADWDKHDWKDVKALEITNMMGDKPLFTPSVQAKMMYDDANLYVIFNVNDRYVRCMVTDINGPVYEEPAVEFFFTPDPDYPDRYFNLEINCGGTPLMHFNDYAIKGNRPLDIDDIKQIEIAHSLPRIVDPEITEPVKWTLEYRIPLSMLKKYSKVVQPEPGVEWNANFYKIAEKGTNIHFLTWSVVDNPVPDFHLPHFFGTIKFN
jgi:hypothetical protein